MKKLALLFSFAFVCPLLAQDAVEFAKDKMLKHWTTSRDFTIEVANAMPADSYGFRPSQEEMSFGQLMGHIATANYSACAMVVGSKAPAPPEKIAAGRKDPNAIDKDSAVKFLTDSFNYCLKVIPQLTDQNLSGMTGPEGRQTTGYERMWGYFVHTAHHRGQAEVYLRVKNIKPPAYKF
jgi:uncharacterized damage-inducible protein DinB